MNTLIANLLKGFNFWQIIFLLYKVGGRDAVTRFFTVPQSVLEKVPTGKIPGRLVALVEERDEFVEEAMELLDAAIDEDWVDPD